MKLMHSIVKPVQEGDIPIHTSTCRPPDPQCMASPFLREVPLRGMRHCQRSVDSQSLGLHSPPFSEVPPWSKSSTSKITPCTRCHSDPRNTLNSHSPPKSTRVYYFHTWLFGVNCLPLRAFNIVFCVESKVGRRSGLAGCEYTLEDISRYLRGSMPGCCGWVGDGNGLEKVCEPEDC
jgi:hypothetical protein